MSRRFYLDVHSEPVGGDHPEPGHLLLGPIAAYIILDAWPTETATDINRWTLTVRRCGTARDPGPEAIGARVWRYLPHRR